MQNEATAQFGAHGIMHTIATKKVELLALLMRNGVAIDPTASNLDIAMKTISLLRMSKSFRKELVALFSNDATPEECYKSYMSFNGQFANFGGFVTDPTIDFSILPSGNTWNPTGSSTTPPASTSTTPTTTGGGFFSAANITNLFNSGINALLTLDTNKTNRILGNSASNVAMYNAQNQGSMQYPYVPPKDNTVLYVLLGVLGVAGVGFLIYKVANK